MNLDQKQKVIIVLAVFFLIVLSIVAWIEGGRARAVRAPDAVITAQNRDCVDCHRVKSPGIVGQWEISKHAESGIGCLQCHSAESGDLDAYDHEGALIATIVTPGDCSKCHEKEASEFQASHHATAAQILGSLDNVLAEVVEGYVKFDPQGNKVTSSAAANSGCLQCHGSEIKVLADGKLDPDTWPNTGIGRINPDGTRGSCSACHLRHNFSQAQSRMPENCGRCHLGPDHPQKEIYDESKHGIAFVANRSRYEPVMKEKEWIPGKQFEQGPTCSVCHMGATEHLPMTHDVGERISWTLRPAISEKVDAAAIKSGKSVKPWEQRRSDMQDVCSSCHGPEWIGNWYNQYDNAVTLYNEKFGIPSTELYKMARSSGLLTEIEFDEEIEFTYFLLWHHEGRRARHGAAMMGPDYTQWHGFFEIAERFYVEFVPQLKELIRHGRASGKAVQASQLEAKMNEILNSDMHKWSIGKLSAGELEVRKQASEEFKKRYAR